MMALDDTTLTTLADRMLADYDNATPGTVFAEGLRLTPPEAWRLQTAVADLREARGERVVGYKIGCVCKGNQKMMGLTHPAWGRIWSSELHATGADLQKARYSNPSMEAEFAISLAAPVDPARTTAEELVEVIEAVYPVIEIHNFTLRGEEPRGAELIANNAILAGVVRGAPVSDIKAPRTTDLKLIYDGETVDAWDGLEWPGGMLTAVGWLAERLAGLGKRLEAGDTILTGAWGPPIPMDGRTRVDVTSSGFGDVSARFT